MKIKNFMRHALIAMLFGGVCLSGHAQSTTQGAIAGTVTDDTDAAIPNTKVVIHNNATNADVLLKSRDKCHRRGQLCHDPESPLEDG
jgi:hypothetical protein